MSHLNYTYNVENSHPILSQHDQNQNQSYHFYQNGQYDRFGYFYNAVGIRAHNVEDQRACHGIWGTTYDATLNKMGDFNFNSPSTERRSEINKKDSASKRHKRENKDNSFILDSLARAKSRKGRKDTLVSKVVSF